MLHIKKGKTQTIYRGDLWNAVVSPRISSMGQVDLFKNQSYSVGLCQKKQTNKQTNKQTKIFKKQMREIYKHVRTMKGICQDLDVKWPNTNSHTIKINQSINKV